MSEEMLAFIIWAVGGIAIILLGIYDMFSKKEVPFGFWANAKPFDVTDVKAYNRAVGKLFCVYGVVFILLGVPLLQGKNTVGIIVTVLGAMFISIAAMVVYVTVIEKKYRKK